MILCIRKYVSLFPSSYQFSPVERRKQAPRSRSQVKKYNRTWSLREGIIALNDYRHQQNNHILSHLCPYKAHTQDKLMSCLVQKTCTRQYIQNNRELYTLASSATSVHLWHYHQNSPCSHATLDVYNSFWQIPELESCSTNLVLSKTKFLLELADAAAPTYFRSCGKTSPPEGSLFVFSLKFGDFQRLSLAIIHKRTWPKHFYSSKQRFLFVTNFLSPFGDNNSQKQIMSKIFLCSKLNNCQKSKNKFA